ncbi:MAG: outer membrane beta-barrel protein, partial [Chitinophagaceae bacterium]|nr:outer membrane beta-barrel protein [Chitinophagaceae bacterium]
MKKILSLLTCTLVITALSAQDTTLVLKKKPVDLSGRSNDHLLVQFGYTNWAGAPDSVKTSGFSKSFNVYLMYDFPFKTNPKLSMAFGPGISSDHIIFKETYVGIKDLTTTLRFTDQSDTNHFKKTKLATSYLEAPIEFRYTADPSNPNKSFKAAIGVKVGLLLNAHTRNVELQNSSDQTLNDYVMKESGKR